MEGLIGWMGPAYVWVKAAHVIVTFFWIAGLFMLPRYLAYQAAEAPGSAADRQWVERVGRLKRIILTPSLVLVWLLGLAVALHYGLGSAGWIHTKITLALLLSGYQGWMGSVARRMAQGGRPMPEKALRLWNEVPALFTILFVVLAVAKPF